MKPITDQHAARVRERLVRDLRGGPILRVFMDECEKVVADAMVHNGEAWTKRISAAAGDVAYHLAKGVA